MCISFFRDNMKTNIYCYTSKSRRESNSWIRWNNKSKRLMHSIFIQQTIFNLSYVRQNNFPKVRHSGMGFPVRFLIASRTCSTRTSSLLQYRSLRICSVQSVWAGMLCGQELGHLHGVLDSWARGQNDCLCCRFRAGCYTWFQTATRGLVLHL